MINLCKKVVVVNIVWYFYKKKIMVKVKLYMVCNYYGIVCCSLWIMFINFEYKKIGFFFLFNVI